MAQLDDKTLILLATICDLTGQSHGLQHIEFVFNRSVEQVRQYRQGTVQDEEYGPDVRR
jgi:hypothetical protein